MTRAALSDLVARYAAAVDDRSFPAAARLFTEDGVLAMPDPPTRFGPSTVHTGRPAIEGALRAVTRFPITRHSITGQVFDTTPNAGAASGRITCVAHHLSAKDSGEIRDFVWYLRYLDTYRETGGAWLFTRREIHLDWVETRAPRAWRVDT